MLNDIFHHIRKTFGFLSHEEALASLAVRLKIEEFSRSIAAQSANNVDFNRITRGRPVPTKEKLRPRSILEDWEITQDSI